MLVCTHMQIHTYAHSHACMHTEIGAHKMEDMEQPLAQNTNIQPRAKRNVTYRLSHSLEGGKRDRTTETGLDASTPAVQRSPLHCMPPTVPNSSSSHTQVTTGSNRRLAWSRLMCMVNIHVTISSISS